MKHVFPDSEMWMDNVILRDKSYQVLGVDRAVLMSVAIQESKGGYISYSDRFFATPFKSKEPDVGLIFPASMLTSVAMKGLVEECRKALSTWKPTFPRPRLP